MKEAIKLWIPILLLIGGGFWLTSRFIQPAPKKELTIATGREGGVYYTYALRYKKLLEKEGITVHLKPTAGSVETRKLLLSHQADIGFMQEGTAHKEDAQKLRAIAAIYPEPLWIFVTKKSKIATLNDLKNKYVAIGERGSGTFALSRKILQVAGIDNNHTAILDINDTKACTLLKKGEIDALFRVIAATSPKIRNCFEHSDLSVLPLRRIDAFLLHFPYLKKVTLPEGAIDLAHNLPSHDLDLLAASATVVTTDKLDKVLVRLMAKVIKQAPNSPALLKSDGTDYPNITATQLPIHPSAERYFKEGDTWLEKIFPFWIAANIYRLKIMLIPILTLLIPLLKSFFPLYRWRIRSKIYRWYRQLNEIDRQIETLSADKIEEEIEKLEKLQDEIKQHTDVPLSYMGEYYLLRTHVAFVLQRLEEQKSEKSA